MIEFKFSEQDMAQWRGKFKELKKLPRAFLVRVGAEAERELKFGVLTGQVLKVRTGHLRRSMGTRITGSAEADMVATTGSGVRTGKRMVYANIHEVGGTILPKKGKYLAIPLPAALTKSRSQLRGGAISFRDFKNTFVARSKSGNLMIFQKQGKRGKIQALAVLKSKVTLPARRYLTVAGNQVMPKMPEIFNKAVEAASK